MGKFLNVDHIYFYQNNLLDRTTSPRIAWVPGHCNSDLDTSEEEHISFSQMPTFMRPLLQGELFQATVCELPPSQLKAVLTEQKVVSILVLPVMVNDDFLGFVRLDDCARTRAWQMNELQLLKHLTSNLSHIIKQEQAQKSLMDNEAKFRSLVQNGSDLIAIVDAGGIYKYVAPTSTKVLGIPPHEFIGKSAFDFIYKDDVQSANEALNEILKRKRLKLKPHRIQDHQNHWRWIQTDLTNHLADPTIQGIVANSRDITEYVEKRIGEKLLASLTKIICRPGPLTVCLSQALQELLGESKFNAGEVWLMSEDKSHLNLISKAFQDENFEAFHTHRDVVDNVKKGEGLAGHIWKIQKTHRWDTLPENAFLHSRAEKVKLKTALGIPIVYNEEFLGCVICFSQYDEQQFLPPAKLLSEIGFQMGPVIKQKIIEEHYRNFFNISPDPQCILGFDGQLKKFNNAFNKLLGYDSSELMNRPFSHFLHQDDRAAYKAKLKSHRHGAHTETLQARFLTKKGEVKHLVWKGTVIPEEKIIIAAAKDISEQKIAEQQLSAAYGRLKTAQKIAKLGYWVRNFDSDFSVWSEEAYFIHGYTPDNFMTTWENVVQTFHPDDRHLIESDPNGQLEPGKIKSFEHRIITASKEIKWVHQEIRILADEKNIPYQIEGTIQDITEKKEYELQLTKSNERFKLAMAASNEMIWEIDNQNNTVIRSKGYEKRINYETSEPFTKNNSWFRSIYPEDQEAVWQSLQNALQNKEETYWYKEYRILTSEGSIAYVIDRCYIVRDKKGVPLQSVGCALDVTDSKQQLEKIKLQNKNLREIARLQSHVIRAPLTRIMSLIHLAKDHAGGGMTLQDIFCMISASAEELDRVIHEIIDKTDTLKENGSTDFTD